MKKLSTTTGLYRENGHCGTLRNPSLVFETLHEVGYRCLDLGFCEQTRPDFILAGSDWEKKIDVLGECAARLGIEIYQTHIPFYPGCSKAKFEDLWNDEFEEFVRRAYVASVKLGVSWAVVHPITDMAANAECQASLDLCHKKYDVFIEMGLKGGVGTCYENMLPCMDLTATYRYCQRYEELIDLVDSYHDARVGICWDTGHANQNGILDQGRAIRMIGTRLHTLHINDNHFGNKRDEHLVPWMGDIKWADVIGALVDVGYDGTLNYETGKMAMEAYDEIQLNLVRLTYENGLYFVKQYEKALQVRR